MTKALKHTGCSFTTSVSLDLESEHGCSETCVDFRLLPPLAEWNPRIPDLPRQPSPSQSPSAVGSKVDRRQAELRPELGDDHSSTGSVWLLFYVNIQIQMDAETTL